MTLNILAKVVCTLSPYRFIDSHGICKYELKHYATNRHSKVSL